MKLRRNKIIGTFFITALFALLYSCATTVQTYNPERNDLSDYSTFAYLPNTNADVEGKRYADEKVNKSIVEAVRIDMQKEGYKLDRENPDLLVLISTSVDVRTTTETEPVYATYPYNYGIVNVNPYYEPYYYYDYGAITQVVGYNTTTYSYDEGTLVIDLIDRETKNTVWKGVASEEIYERASTSAIQEMVDEIFEEFPSTKTEKDTEEMETAEN